MEAVPSGIGQRTAETVVQDHRCRHEERHHGTVPGLEFDQGRHSGMAFFGDGGLIHAAVGLSGGVGALLTKRSGLARNA